jgi:hypothetical protein
MTVGVRMGEVGTQGAANTLGLVHKADCNYFHGGGGGFRSHRKLPSFLPS